MTQKTGLPRQIRFRLEMCSTCMKMCRDNCPTVIASASENLTPYIRSLHVNLNEKGIRSYDQGALESIFSCLTCNLCNSFCLPKVDEAELMELARASIVESGIDVSQYSKIAKSISEHHNPLNETHANRYNSVKDLIRTQEDVSSVLFLGCMGSYREIEIARASIELLQKLKVEFTIMEDEWCCGSPAIRTGFLSPVIEAMNHNVEEWQTHAIKEIITPCSACYRVIKDFYPKHRPNFNVNVMHISEVIYNKLGDISREQLKSKVTYHDPCHLGRGMNFYDVPRKILQKMEGVSVLEMDHSREKGFCCGAGGGVRSNFPELADAVRENRITEALETGAEYLISACPLCKYHFKKSANLGQLKVIDLVELVNRIV